MTKARPFIAVVDDEEPIRRALTRLLQSAGLDAEAFDSGAKFLESIPPHRPDCVVLDLHMPGINGFEVLERFAAQYTPVAVIVLTGHDKPGNAERVRALGAADYLLKPVNDQVLLDAIESVLNRGSSELDARQKG